VLSHGPEGLS